MYNEGFSCVFFKGCFFKGRHWSHKTLLTTFILADYTQFPKCKEVPQHVKDELYSEYSVSCKLPENLTKFKYLYTDKALGMSLHFVGDNYSFNISQQHKLQNCELRLNYDNRILAYFVFP